MDQYLRLNFKGVRQLELFCDESAKAIYEDGSVIQLSSCGSVFRYCRQGSEETITQHVDYCISKHKEDVCTLVRFRNLWAEKAFVPFVDVAMVRKASWPENTIHNIVTLENGNRMLTSTNNSCSVELFGHHQVFVVSYLVDVWREGARSQPIKVFQTHSVSSMPTEWQCVVESMTTGTPHTIKDDPCSGLSVLYGHCPRSHLHTWTGPGLVSAKEKLIKVLWTSKGALYRLHYRPNMFVEVFGCDGTYVKSHDSRGKFFSCWFPSPPLRGGSVEWTQRTCSADHPSPISVGGHGLLLSNLLSTCENLLKTACEVQCSAVMERCWEERHISSPEPPHPLPTVVAHTIVKDIGIFKALSSGRVRVDFVNTVSLESYCPCVDAYHKGAVSSSNGYQLTFGVCEMSLSTGQCSVVSAGDTDNWYVGAVSEWCKWLSLSSADRPPFTLKLVTKEDIVREEIGRIRAVLKN